jgi:uncharacterized pyridoxal phosphate-containing UPF0001 family protein
LKNRIEQVKKRIKDTAEACKRPMASIRLVAVSKTMPAEVVQDAIEAGILNLGENYIQEAKEKINALAILSAICSPTRPNTLSGCLISSTR